MLQGEASHSIASKHRRMLLGRPVCHHAFRLLVGIGSSRFRTLRKAAASGRACPIDGRFFKRRFSVVGNAMSEAAQKRCQKRQAVLSFLQELYEQTAEPMATISGKKGPGDGFMKFKRQRGRRPKHFLEREQRVRTAVQAGRTEMRYLPPGSFQDYHELLKAQLIQRGEDSVGIRLFKTAAQASEEFCFLPSI